MTNAQIKLQVKMILALSFVKSENVLEYASKLKEFIITEENQNVLDLFEWFYEEYLTNTIGNKSFEFWNVKLRTENNIPRTTNSLEGYHRHLNSLISIKQSSIITILNELKSEQTITENKIFYLLYNSPETKEDSVKELLKKYETYSPIDYLEHIALNFNWKLD